MSTTRARGGARLGRRAVVLLGAALTLAGGLLSSGVWRASVREVPMVLNEVPVTAMDLVAGPAYNSPQLVADPTDPAVVVLAHRRDAPRFGCGLQVSGDAGKRWASLSPVPTLPEGADTCYAPEVAFGPDGVLYYLFVGLAGAGNEPMGVFLTTSTDRGASFTAPHQILGPLNFGVRLSMDATRGPAGRLHLVWLHASSDPPLGGFGPPPNPILTAHSDDSGRSFSEPVQVSDEDRQHVVAPALAISPAGDVHVAYYELGDDTRDYHGLDGPPWDGTWSLVVSRSSDGGASFEAGSVVSDGVTPRERVMLVFTMPPPALLAWSEGRCLAWTDGRHGDADAMVSCSRGDTWEEPVRLNDDATGNGISQYLPQLSVSAGGRVDALFYDRRDGPQNLATEVYFVASHDEGRTFGANMKVTGDSFDPRIGQQYDIVSAEGQVEFGSRLGLLSRPDAVVAAWTDTRNYEGATTGQDVMLAEIALPGRTVRGRPAGLTIAVLGFVMLAVVTIRRTARPTTGASVTSEANR